MTQNDEKQTGNCVKAVLTSECDDIYHEAIVVDNFLTDNSQEIMS